MRFLLFIYLTLVMGMSCLSQLSYNFEAYDFGDLYATDDRFVDVVMTNNSSEKIYVLRIEQIRTVSYLLEKDFILPNTSVKLRIQVNPKTTGKFSYKIPIYTSNQDAPTTIKLTGTLKEMGGDMASMQDCPDFSKRPTANQGADFKLTVVTIDAQTKEPISDVAVVMLQNGRPIGKVVTEKQGKVKTQIPLGVTYFYGDKSGYEVVETAQYVNFKRNKVVLELERTEATSVEEVQVAEKETPQREISIEEADTVVPIVELEKIKEFIVRRTPPSKEADELSDTLSVASHERNFNALAKDDFNSIDFKPLNIVFVIDVSSSMRQEDRLELMKYALYELVEKLRPEDQMGLVAYATKARILLPVTSGDNKEEITTIVEGMKASGLTAGAEGIKLGFKQVRKNFKPDAHNHVIVITDGAFNTGSTDYEKLFRRYLKRDITLSVVGIKNNERAEKNMREVATIGQGQFIPIQGLADAQENLFQALRVGAFRE